ncbi:hypothetical protein Y032_0613g673 [Ancylostoma ceylanicum]|uniref:Uncharacterized protein n=1 Tax=Ancylostoma ceylanicum TaxID=53326 RepID=A0A016WLC3_9BILA|nr:hypothetical protein Y032_0613g673 [Ancylostoma ceylanicum]
MGPWVRVRALSPAGPKVTWLTGPSRICNNALQHFYANMGDAEAAATPLLDFDSQNEVVLQSSTYVTSKSNSSSLFCPSIPVEDSNLDIESLKIRLHQHARDGNVKALEALLNKHPQIDVNMSDLTALHYAAQYGRVEAAELLLNKGASLESFTYKDRYYPLHMVAKYGQVGAPQHNSRDFMKSFIDASAGPPHSELQNDRSASASDPTTALVNLFVERGADVNIEDQYGMRPLDHASLKDNEAAVRALVKNGAILNGKDSNESTPLLKACMCSSYNLVHFLLSSGADCNVRDNSRNSAYHMAARHGRNDILQLLIEHAGEHAVELLWRINDENKTPLELAVNGNHASTVNIILSMKPLGSNSPMFQSDKWLLHKAAEKGSLDVIKVLIQNGYNVRLRDRDGKLPLHAAAISKKEHVVGYLLELAVCVLDH